MHITPKQAADTSNRRVEAGPKAVVVGVVNDQSAQTCLMCLKQMCYMKNTIMIWAWLKRRKEKSSGRPYEGTFQIAFVSLVQEGTRASTNDVGAC